MKTNQLMNVAFPNGTHDKQYLREDYEDKLVAFLKAKLIRDWEHLKQVLEIYNIGGKKTPLSLAEGMNYLVPMLQHGNA